MLGREFRRDVLGAIWTGSRGLASVRPRALDLGGVHLSRSATERAQRYIFKHALIQDAAYESLLEATG